MKKQRTRETNRATSVSRRQFLKRATTAGVAAVAAPYIVPASALGRSGHVAPSKRIVIGCVGVGGMGTGNMNSFLGFREAQVVAVCDVDKGHRENARNIVNKRYSNEDCAEYDDFRELLARDDLDVMSMATPDHWHAITVISAAKRGLDIYGEKPLSLTIHQGRIMSDTIKRYRCVWQTGSWQRSQSNFRKGCELVRSGRIGDVHTVKVGLPTGPECGPQPEMPIPEGFDYDFWLGPAPQAPYTQNRCHWNFRWILDYSGGQLTDWAAHHCDIANWGMGTEYTGPIEVEGKGEYPRDGLYNAATNYRFTAKYAPGASPVAPNGFVMDISNAHRGGTLFEGTEGWVFVTRGGFEASPASLKDSIIGPNDVRLCESTNHHRNFLECVRSRRDTITPIEVAHRAISIAHLGNIAMQLERKVKWNPEKERFVNDPEADRKLNRSMRAPWRL